MGKYKLIALDMDGTMLNDASEVSEENEKWIHKALDAGVDVIFSTGRGFQSAYPFAQQLKLETPMITVNGGEIWSRPHVLHQRIQLGSMYVKQLHQLARAYPEVWYWAYSTVGIYNKENWFQDAENYDSYHWLKFGYYTEDDAAREAILAEVQSWGALEISNSSPHNIELNPQGVSKASALRELCKVMNIDMSQVVAAGDSLNDIAAIREAGLGVAMANAQEEVKLAADVVTLSNNEHGVAELIKRYVLN